jgi:hypothetical protein
MIESSSYNSSASLVLVGQGQNFGLVLRDQNGMFKLCGERSVDGCDGPIISPLETFGRPHGEHGFNGEDHSGSKFQGILVSKVLWYDCTRERDCESKRHTYMTLL